MRIFADSGDDLADPFQKDRADGSGTGASCKTYVSHELFKRRPVPVVRPDRSMPQLMNNDAGDLRRVRDHGRYEDLVDGVSRGTRRPALSDPSHPLSESAAGRPSA
jgi:hypothetical protein